MIPALQHTLDEYLKLLIPGTVVIVFFITDNTESFVIPHHLLDLRNKIDNTAANIKDLFSFDFCLEIDSSKETDLTPLFPINFSVTNSNLDAILDSVMTKIISHMKLGATRAKIKELNTATVQIVAEVKETKKELAREVDAFEAKSSEKVTKIKEVQVKIAEELEHCNTLFLELCNFNQTVAFAELSAEKFISEWLYPNINIRDRIVYDINFLEKEEKRLIEELQKESESVLDLIDLKLSTQLASLERVATNLNKFVVNVGLLGPNVKQKIEQLLLGIQKENISELDKKFATKDLKKKVATYKEFLLSQKEKTLLTAQSSLEETIKFKEEIIKKIKDVIKKSTDPALEARKEDFKMKLKLINKQIALIQGTLKQLKETENEDFGF